MRGMRLAIALVTAATLVALFVVARPDDGAAPASPATSTPTRTEHPQVEPLPTTTAETRAATTPEPVRLTVRVEGGRPVDGIARAEARKGGEVVLVVRADVADHVHVHGYDLSAETGPGRPATLRFRASLTGRFEIELEELGRPIAQLTVVP